MAQASGMKLSEVTMREKVPTVGPGESALRLRCEVGPGPNLGWELVLDGDLIKASKAGTEMLIPLSNVAYMRRLVEVPVIEIKKPVRAA